MAQASDTPNSQRALSSKKDKEWKDHIPAEILNDLSRLACSSENVT